jgi:YHS domain-containing protein
MAIDPVCNMEVDEATAQWTSEYKGQTYYFCAPGCKVSFDENPEKFLGEGGDHGDHMHHDHHHSESTSHSTSDHSS